jgi:hypothetical protein
MLHMRRFACWYTQVLPPGRRGCTRGFQQLCTLADLDALLAELPRDLPFPREGLRVKRGKSTGVQTVALPDGYLATREDDRAPCEAAGARRRGGRALGRVRGAAAARRSARLLEPLELRLPALEERLRRLVLAEPLARLAERLRVELRVLLARGARRAAATRTRGPSGPVGMRPSFFIVRKYLAASNAISSRLGSPGFAGMRRSCVVASRSSSSGSSLRFCASASSTFASLCLAAA